MYDIAIVGAGPVGLLLAGELGLAGCSVLVLEREAEPGSPWRSAPLGMRGLSAASLEVFHRRGLLEPLMAASGYEVLVDPATDAPPRAVGHFAGIVPEADIDPGELPYRLPSPTPDHMMTTLDAVESVLADHAIKHGARIRRGVSVRSVTQTADGVRLGDGESEHAARWVVGCDGGRSTVRKLTGFGFVGTPPRFTGYLALAAIADPEKLDRGFNVTPTGTYLRMNGNEHIGMMDFDDGGFDRSAPLTREHLQTVLRRVSGTDVTLDEVRLASSFTDRAMQATSYRHGRVLLAGDAAHIHSPLGGQGLNLGLGDAVNLGWKLAATVHGGATDALLDSYTAERHPVAARVLDWSRAQAEIMRPDPRSRAVRDLLTELFGTRDGATLAFGRMSGLATRYDLGSAHPLVGRSAPDFRFTDGSGLGDLLRDGHGVALDVTGSLPDVTPGRDRLRFASGPVADDLGLGAVLIRPDGVVAWADGPDPDRAAFSRAVDEWFGPARR